MDHNLPPAQQLQVGLRTHEADFSSKQVSEPSILRDIMFIFQGIDGTYIKFDPESDAYVIDETVKCPPTLHQRTCKVQSD